MSQITLRKTFNVDGSPADVDSFVLSNATGTVGVETSTGAVVVAAGQAMARVGVGVYEHTFTEPDVNLAYVAYYRIIRNGATYQLQETIVAGYANAIGYADRGDVEDVFGVPNIKKWALLSGSDAESATGQAEISGRIARAIGWANDQINNSLREGGYDPIPITSAGAANTLAILCATIAGVWLYENRGTPEYNQVTGQPEHRYAWKKKEADKMLDAIAARKIRLDAPHPEHWSNAPFAQQTPRGTPANPLGNYGYGHGTGGGVPLQ